MKTATKKTKVVTYQSARGSDISLCPQHIAELEANREWPKDACGEEYCRVSHGLHWDYCDLCNG